MMVVGNRPVHFAGGEVDRPDVVSVILEEHIIPHDYRVGRGGAFKRRCPGDTQGSPRLTN